MTGAIQVFLLERDVRLSEKRLYLPSCVLKTLGLMDSVRLEVCAVVLAAAARVLNLEQYREA